MKTIRILRDEWARLSDQEPAIRVRQGQVIDVRDSTADGLIAAGAAEAVGVVTAAVAHIATVDGGPDAVEGAEAAPAPKRGKKAAE